MRYLEQKIRSDKYKRLYKIKNVLWLWKEGSKFVDGEFEKNLK